MSSTGAMGGGGFFARTTTCSRLIRFGFMRMAVILSGFTGYVR